MSKKDIIVIEGTPLGPEEGITYDGGPSKYRAELIAIRNCLVEASTQNDDRCWFNVEIILNQTIERIDELLKEIK